MNKNILQNPAITIEIAIFIRIITAYIWFFTEKLIFDDKKL